MPLMPVMSVMAVMAIRRLGWLAAIASAGTTLSTSAFVPADEPRPPAPPRVSDGPPRETRSLLLPDGQRLTAIGTTSTAYAWEGRLSEGERHDASDGKDGRLIEIVTAFGPVTVVWLPDGRCLQRLPIGDGRFRLHDEPLRDPGCRAIPPSEDDRNDQAAARLGNPCDDGDILDVLVKWTPAARIQAGGDIAIRSLAEASVAISNHVYATSDVRVRMRAVGYGETESYDLDLTDQVLTHLRVNGDGYLDSVHAEREMVGADLVALIQGTSSYWCGVAYLLGVPAADYGFSCTVWSCALGNLTFTHEVGHNQGCCHAPGDGGGCTTGGVFPYSTGHRFTGDSGTLWRTVMAYSPGSRWPRLSSPDVLHDGTPTGLPGENGSDNARTVRETAETMANFRCSVIPDDGSAVHLISPELVPPTNGESISFTATGLPPADPAGSVLIEAVAVADLNAANELLSLRLGNLDLGPLVGASGEGACQTTSDALEVAAAIFNSELVDGDLQVTIVASTSVGAECPASELRITARYVAAEDPCGLVDSDGDGTPDGCDACPTDPAKTEPGLCGCGVADVDTDGDGTPDCLDGCPEDPDSIDPEDCGCGPGDIDLDGDVDVDDVVAIIVHWNSVDAGPADCNGDGLVNGQDLAIVLGGFGGCG